MKLLIASMTLLFLISSGLLSTPVRAKSVPIEQYNQCVDDYNSCYDQLKQSDRALRQAEQQASDDKRSGFFIGLSIGSTSTLVVVLLMVILL